MPESGIRSLEKVGAIKMDKRLKIVTVGTGNIFYGWGGGSGHLPSYLWVADEARLTAICDVNATSLNRAALAVKKYYAEKAANYREHGFTSLADLLTADSDALKTYSNLGEMLKVEKPDIVDVITPCEYHAETIREALAAGCHVICEKPLARTWLESEEIAADVKKSGKVFFYGENFIYADPWHDIAKLIRKGEIGELEAIWMPQCISEPGSINYMKGGIGALLDMGSHAVTLAWYLIGFDCSPIRVRAIGPDGVAVRIGKRFINGELMPMAVEDYAAFSVEFEDAGTGRWINAYIEASWAYDDCGPFRVVGSRGEIRLEDGKIVVIDQFGQKHVREIGHCDGWLNSPPAPGYAGQPQQLKSMVRLIKTGGQPSCNVHIGSETVAIAQAAYLSEAKNRKAVSLEEFKEYARGFAGKPELLQKELIKNGINRTN
jgi:predicted dehydrogenase